MQVNVIDLEGKPKGTIELPKVFEEPVREDLIHRAVLAAQSNRRQPYGTDRMAGMRTSAHYHGKRRMRYAMMGREMARLPRLHGKTVPFLNMRARRSPQTVGGRRAHPPLVEKVWELKINDSERKKAIRSAIAATASKDLIIQRGHRIQGIKEFPIVVDDKLQELEKTKDIAQFLNKIGLEKEIERISDRKVRPGKGKNRSRKYKNKVGPLFVVSSGNANKAVRNIPGCDVCNVKNLSVESLAPGASAGRLTIFTKSAIENLK